MNTLIQFFNDLVKRIFSSKKVLKAPQQEEDYEAWLGV
jgi:hypothetical protein